MRGIPLPPRMLGYPRILETMKKLGQWALGAIAVGFGLWLSRTDLPPVELELGSWTAWLIAVVVMVVAIATRVGSWLLLGASCVGLVASVVSAVVGRPWGMLLALSVVAALAALVGIVGHKYANTPAPEAGDADAPSG